jgi:hypothetical protein
VDANVETCRYYASLASDLADSAAMERDPERRMDLLRDARNAIADAIQHAPHVPDAGGRDGRA